MFNPILGELIAREQYNDYLRQAAQNRMINAAIAQQPAHRFNLRTIRSNALVRRVGTVRW